MAIGTAGSLLAGRYRVVERLGSGGMAAVYLAHDERLDRRVAVKRLHAGGDDDMDARRFEREGKIGASLSHPNLVSIFDAEQDDESVLLIMEYVAGETLADLLSRGPVEPRRAVAIVRAVAAALDHAHAGGIVHRDIKPGNVLLGRNGSVKLADLGIAKAVERTGITGTGTVLGTPAYMAPEQLEGGPLGPGVDVYALAAVAFEMLTGAKAREGRTAVEIAHRVVTEEPPDARAANPDVPAEAARAIRRGMAMDAAARPASAGQLADELERAFEPSAPPPATRKLVAARAVAPVPPRRKEGRAVAPWAEAARPAPRAQAPPLRRGSRERARPGWLLAVLGLLALAVAAVAIAIGSGGDQSQRGGGVAGGTAQQPSSGVPGQAPAAEPEPAAEPAPATPAPAPAPAKGVPQPKGKGTVEEAHALQAEGYAALQGGDYKDAAKLSRKSIEAFPPGTADPQYAYALFNLGRALRLDGKPDDAIPVLEARLQIPNQTATVQRELDAARAAADE
jgi:serine/threonine-protein kinase